MDKELLNVFENLREAVVVADGDRVKYFNSAAKKLFEDIALDSDAGEIFRDVRDIDGVQHLPDMGEVTVSHVGELTVYTAGGEIEEQQLLAAELSRDMRDILADMNYSTQIIFKGMEDVSEKQQRYMSIFDRAYYRMMYLVENIEALYDESSVNSKPSLRVISLEKLCYDVADIVSCLMDGRVRVTFRGPNDPMCCSLDRDKIERMLLNIVCNSLRNIEMGTGRLDIRLSKERDMAVIAIKDNGSGIPEEKKHDIFDMRVKARRLDDAKAGLGLGLPIAARLAAQHRGKVSVESGADGTTVKVYIPMIIDNILPFRSPDPVDYMNMRRVLTSLSSAMPADCYKKKYGD